MNHAMAFAGVDVADDGTTAAGVENSWGAKIADKGYFTHVRRLVHRIRLRGSRPEGPVARGMPAPSKSQPPCSPHGIRWALWPDFVSLGIGLTANAVFSRSLSAARVSPSVSAG